MMPRPMKICDTHLCNNLTDGKLCKKCDTERRRRDKNQNINAFGTQNENMVWMKVVLKRCGSPSMVDVQYATNVFCNPPTQGDKDWTWLQLITIT